MFTGIIQTQATVINANQEDGVQRLVLSVERGYLGHLDIGASIAINGCCLTVVHFEVPPQDVVGQVHFDVIDETLLLTNLGNLRRGMKVNFERSVTFGTELGGHIVSGHIHDTAKVEEIIHEQNNCRIKLTLPSKWMKYIMYKGFVSVNGASLTVGNMDDTGFWLHLIPETLQITNIGLLEVGDAVNIEVDQHTLTIVNTVENYLRKQST
ncbi:riboflavin synthase subunit alpha [Pseudoalteromonas xiamenensis]|uniref:riboflavin synthase subunit alpha n=1 Tax=Pseudoalteromonas xiamenensis TaxID=882626 RepID=UPI0027E4A15C|nr:riboflavin synthase subunit alpha [Pseudoalteromonas xiamenensis]WMN60018.1 riboflavin synthase subunit alpha [Pseudoalteromonas xiamenensis]